MRFISAQLLRSGVTTFCEGTTIAATRTPSSRQSKARASTASWRAAWPTRISPMPRSTASHRSVVGEGARGRSRSRPAHTEEFLARFPGNGRGLVRGAVNASSLLGFSGALFREGARIAEKHGVSFQVHIGRDREEVELCLAVWGRRPIERLQDLGVISRRLVAVHAVLASEGEIELLARGGAGLAHSPT